MSKFKTNEQKIVDNKKTILEGLKCMTEPFLFVSLHLFTQNPSGSVNHYEFDSQMDLPPEIVNRIKLAVLSIVEGAIHECNNLKPDIDIDKIN